MTKATPEGDIWMDGYRLPHIPRGCFLVLRTDGSDDIRRFPERKGADRLDALARALGFDDYEIFTLRGRSHLVMVRKYPHDESDPVNSRASWLVGDGTGFGIQVRGDVAVLHDGD